MRQMFETSDFEDVPPAVAEMERSFNAARGGEKKSASELEVAH